MQKSKKKNLDIIKKEDLLCPVKYLIKVLGGKWKLPILCILEVGGTVRFGQIKKKLENVTNVMLSQTLKELEKDGIIIRHQYNEVPPRVDYQMTPKGKKVIPALSMLGDWAKKYMEEEDIHNKCNDCIANIQK